MAKRAIVNKPFHDADMNHNCSVCKRPTCFLFKGKRYCPEHHPDPGPYIRVERKADAA